MADPIYSNETFEVIIARMLARLPDDIDKREGSVVYDLLAPAAIELEQAYMQMDNVLNLGFANTTYGEYLDRRAGEQGLTRKPAVKAIGSVTFSGPEGTLVATGTRLSTSTPIYFVTTANVTIIGGVATIAVEAEIGGVDGNVDAGTITVVLGELSGVVTITNAAPISGGIDEETDDELYARYNEKVSRPITSGNKYQYESWAKEVAGISDAKVYPIWNGPGTVKVVVIDSEKRSPSQTVLDVTIDHIESQRPIGATVTVLGVTEVPIDVSADLTLSAGAVLDDVKTAISANLTDYYKQIAFVDNTVRYSKIANAIFDANGVIDYANLQVNGNVANLTLGADEVPVLGAVLVNQL